MKGMKKQPAGIAIAATTAAILGANGHALPLSVAKTAAEARGYGPPSQKPVTQRVAEDNQRLAAAEDRRQRREARRQADARRARAGKRRGSQRARV